jgi:hypothetical protein
MTFLVYLKGSPLVQGHVRMRFRWVPKYALYLWDGKETEAKDLDEVCDTVFVKQPIYRQMFPSVKITPGTNAPQPPQEKEITLDQALEVVERYAPHRLKQKTGPKAKAELALA